MSSALAYLHTKKRIVHFDIKPKNVLIFRYPIPGHDCFTKKTSVTLTCDSCHSEGGGVLVKLADLGISAFLGPSGFQRVTSTPGYTAPEVLKYLGKEFLTEKVAIYVVIYNTNENSLGIKDTRLIRGSQHMKFFPHRISSNKSRMRINAGGV